MLTWKAALALAGRLAPFVLLGLAVWYIHHRGYRDAIADRDAREAKALLDLRTELRASEQRLGDQIAAIAGDYQARHDALAHVGATLQPIILKETARDPRLSDPALGLTPGLLDALNRARATGACTAAAAGRIDCAMPAAGAAPGQRDR